MWPGSQFLWIPCPKATGRLKKLKKTPERSGDTQASRALFLKDGRTAMRASALSPALAGLSISCPCYSLLAPITRKRGILMWNCHKPRVFWQDTSSLGLLFPISKTKGLDQKFCFPWECSGSLACLYLYVIVPRDAASCSMYRESDSCHSDPTKSSPPPTRSACVVPFSLHTDLFPLFPPPKLYSV